MYVTGFTGSRKGMTDSQKSIVKILLKQFNIGNTRHGDCVGADTDFHNIVKSLDIEYVYIHPPTDPKYRAWNVGTLTHEPKPYLIRNKDIVECSELIIATPDSNTEELRSGTWSTIRLAKKLNKMLVIVYPCGRIEKFNT